LTASGTDGGGSGGFGGAAVTVAPVPEVVESAAAAMHHGRLRHENTTDTPIMLKVLADIIVIFIAIILQTTWQQRKPGEH